MPKGWPSLPRLSSPRCCCSTASSSPHWRPARRRALSSWSSHDVEHVSVQCASSGSITVSLHNVSKHPPTSPLLLYLPPFSRPHQETAALLPSFLHHYPVAIINYRWRETLPDETFESSVGNRGRGDGTSTAAAAAAAAAATSNQPGPGPLHWPTPIHDTLFGYEWIVKNLAPPGRERRDVFVYGSYLGAGLAAALALTESHAHLRMAVRGVAAYNGIYNWTTFLPDHPVNRARELELELELAGGGSGGGGSDDGGSAFHYLKQQVPGLFKSPSNLFDPFASPCLFFRTPGLPVPPTFSYHSGLPPSLLLRAVDELALVAEDPQHLDHPEDGHGGGGATVETALKAPRKAYLAFPPRQSSLRIPEALLLYETAPSFSPSPSPLSARAAAASALASAMATAQAARRGRRRPATTPTWRKKRDNPSASASASALTETNSFAAQAAELAFLMRRSVNKLELKERMKWDDEFGDWDHEAERRVRLFDAGAPLATDDYDEDGENDAALSLGLGPAGAGRGALVLWLEERMERMI